VRLAVHWYPLTLNGIYMDSLNAERACEFFQQTIWSRCPAVRKSTPVHAAQIARAALLCFRCLIQFPPQHFALFSGFFLCTFEPDHTQSTSIDGIVLHYDRNLERLARVRSSLFRLLQGSVPPLSGAASFVSRSAPEQQYSTRWVFRH